MSQARIQVPATSANLGPGYDCAGLALQLYDELSAQTFDDDRLQVVISGEGENTVPRNASHLVVKAIARGFAEAGLKLPGLRLECVNRIPHGRGLGSSSAAIVGGLALARELIPNGREVLNDQRFLQVATDIEGHPDNVAPAILGGFTVAWMTGNPERGSAIRLVPSAQLQPVVLIPKSKLATQRARELLPEAVPHADAAANAARAALLVHAITQAPELLLEATKDLLHQDYRRFAYPQSHAVMSELRKAGIPATISGAGPTVIAFGISGSDLDGNRVEAAASQALADVKADSEFEVRQLGVDLDGVK